MTPHIFPHRWSPLLQQKQESDRRGKAELEREAQRVRIAELRAELASVQQVQKEKEEQLRLKREEALLSKQVQLEVRGCCGGRHLSVGGYPWAD